MKKLANIIPWTIIILGGCFALLALGYASYVFLFDYYSSHRTPHTYSLPADDIAMASIDTVGENCQITFRHFYAECSHVEDEVIPPPNRHSQMPLNELLNMHENSVIESKTDTEIMIKIYENKKCDKHYLAKLQGDKIVICYQNDLTKTKETIIKPASSFSYEDTVLLTQGIYLESDEELTKFIEDYAS
jgi:hypothetical protein